MDRLAELLMPYCKKQETAVKIAEELSSKGVVVMPRTGAVTCTFEPGTAIGTVNFDGNETKVYLAEMRAESVGVGRDPTTSKMTGPIRILRRFVMIEI